MDKKNDADEVVRKQNAPPDELKYRLGSEFAVVAPGMAADQFDAIVNKAWESADGKRYIEGYASTRMMDSYDDIIEPKAFESSKELFFKYGGPLLYGHGGWDGLMSMPAGKVLPEYFTIDNIGLRIRAEIAHNSVGDDVWELIKLGVLKSFSVGFSIRKFEVDETIEPPVRTITDLRLYEISVVTIPANPETLFNVVQSNGFQPASVEFRSLIQPIGDKKGGSHHHPTRKDRVMPDKNLNDIIARVTTIEPALDGAPKADDLLSMQSKIMTGFKAIEEKQNELKSNMVTPAEVKHLVETVKSDIGGQLVEFQNTLKTIENAQKIASRRVAVPDNMLSWRKLTPEFFGKSDVDILLRTPVDYKKNANGELIYAIRNIHDAIIFMKKMNAGYARHGLGLKIDLETIKKYENAFNQLIEVYDPEVVKAFSTATSGYGSDWAMAVNSQEMFDVYDLAMQVEGEFEHFTLSGKTNVYPLKTAHMKAWTASAAASNNPDQYKKSEPTTSTVTFTPKKIVAACFVDEEGIEGDSFVPVIPMIRQEIMIAASAGVEDALINGDNSTTHMDTGLTTSTMYTKDAWKGLRKLAVDASKTWDTASASAGVGDATTAFVAKDMRYGRQLLGKRGVRSRDVRYLVSIGVYFDVLNFTEVTQPGNYGAQLQSWITGDVPSLDGCPLMVSEYMSDELTNAGIFDNSSKDYSAFLCFDRTGFVIGDRKDITIEFDKDITTGQFRFVGSLRKDFQKKTPSTEYPVSYGYKISN